MMKDRVSMQDVMELTGLSRSTIDRVIHARSGVRKDTTERIQKALQELGYAPDALSGLLSSRRHNIQVLLSEGTNPFFREIRQGIDNAFNRLDHKGLTVSIVGFDPYAPETVVRRLRQVPKEVTSVITVGVDNPDVQAAIDMLQDRGVRVVTLVSDVPGSKRAAFVGQDNFMAGQTAGRLMCEMMDPGEGHVAVLLGHYQFRHLLDRQSGFQQALGTRRADLTVISTKPYGTCPDTTREIIQTVFAQYPDLKGVYLCGGGQPHLVSALEEQVSAASVVIGHEVTQVSRAALQSGVFNVVVAQDSREVGRLAFDAAMTENMNGHILCSAHIYVAENLPRG
ncbi:MAG: LacI family DNA-binding transcriptional regulator [Sedimentitalea sp.]